MRRRKKYMALLAWSLILILLAAGCSLPEGSSLLPTPSPTLTVPTRPTAVSPSPPPPSPSPAPHGAGGGTGPQPTGSPVAPAPLPTKEGTILYFSAGCPNPEGVEVPAMLTRKEALEVLNPFATGDREQRFRLTDPSLWPLLSSASEKMGPFMEGNLSEPRRARESPYADLLANACGAKVLEASWWVEVCPGSPPPDRFEQCPPGMRMHLFFIRRGGRWLLWGMG
ncbi:MAG TPA: hypothetical protein VNK89_07100 [Thermoflexus sp.]|nr:hypothetical protein [Thermoflexus sp.]